MMLCFVPPWMLPTVTTADSCGSVSRDERLQRQDDARGQNDGVFGQVRIGAMPADALDDDVDRVDVRERIARRIADLPRRQRRAVMKGDREIGPGEAGIKSAVDHGLGAQADLLGRLADHDECARPG
jgi:hypothetical protein